MMKAPIWPPIRLALLVLAAATASLQAQVVVCSPGGFPLPGSQAIIVGEPIHFSFEVDGLRTDLAPRLEVRSKTLGTRLPDDHFTLLDQGHGTWQFTLRMPPQDTAMVLTAEISGRQATPVELTLTQSEQAKRRRLAASLPALALSSSSSSSSQDFGPPPQAPHPAPLKDFTARMPLDALGLALDFAPKDSRQVNRRARLACTREIHRLRVSGNLNDRQLGYLLASRPNLAHLHLGPMKEVTATGLYQALAPLTNLTALEVDPHFCPFTSKHLELVAEKNLGLQHLTVKDSDLMGPELDALWHRLKVLELNMTTFPRDPKHPEREAAALRDILHRCHNLKAFTCEGGNWVRDEDLPPGLECLRLKSCRAFMGSAVPTSLKLLKLDGCAARGLDLHRLTNLNSLTLRVWHGFVTADQVRASLAHGKLQELRAPNLQLATADLLLCRNSLEVLEVQGSETKRQDFSSLTALKTLKMHAGNLLQGEDLPPSLQDLCVSRTLRFTGAGLPAGLRTLALQGCHDVHDLGVLPSGLTSLSLDLCHGLAFPEEAGTGPLHLPASLKRLKISGCGQNFSLHHLQVLLADLPALEDLVVAGWAGRGRLDFGWFRAHPRLVRAEGHPGLKHLFEPVHWTRANDDEPAGSQPSPSAP